MESGEDPIESEVRGGSDGSEVGGAAEVETDEEFAAALERELASKGAELTTEQSQHVSDMDAIYGNLRAHRESLAKLKLLAAFSKAGVTGLPHLNSIKSDIKNQRKAIAVLVELAEELKLDENATVPEPSDLEVLSK